MTIATDHVLTSTEGARQPTVTKKTGWSRWNCQKHIKGTGFQRQQIMHWAQEFPPNSSPQYIKEIKTGYWVFLIPRPLFIPIFLPNVSILPYLLSISPLWSLNSPHQASDKSTHAPSKGKTESRAAMNTMNRPQDTEWRKHPTRLETLDRRHAESSFSPRLLLAKWRWKLRKSLPLFQATQSSCFLTPVWEALWWSLPSPDCL